MWVVVASHCALSRHLASLGFCKYNKQSNGLNPDNNSVGSCCCQLSCVSLSCLFNWHSNFENMHQHANVGARHVHERHTTSGVALRPPSGVPRQRLSRSAAALQTQSSTASDLPQQQLPNGFIIR